MHSERAVKTSDVSVCSNVWYSGTFWVDAQCCILTYINQV